MGNFKGHAVPGTLFLIHSIWLTVDIYLRHFNNNNNNNNNYRNNNNKDNNRDNNSYRNRATSSLLSPAESLIKILATLVGIAGELVTAFEGGRFVHVHNGQHMIMYSFFALNGLADLVCHYFKSGTSRWLPRQLDYLSYILAFVVEGLLFTFHLHGRPPIDVQLHTLLTYVIAMCVLSLVLEMILPDDVRPALARAGFTFLQGTWFWQVGQILYPVFSGTPWDQEDHEQMLLVVMIFAGHLALTVAYMVLMGVAVYFWCCCCCCGFYNPQHQNRERRRRIDDFEDYEKLLTADEDEDDDAPTCST